MTGLCARVINVRYLMLDNNLNDGFSKRIVLSTDSNLLCSINNLAFQTIVKFRSPGNTVSYALVMRVKFDISGLYDVEQKVMTFLDSCALEIITQGENALVEIVGDEVRIA